MRCTGSAGISPAGRWPIGRQEPGAGALLTGDILQVLPDRRHLGFMRSYPCLIPLPPAEVRRMAAHCDRLAFEAIYGAFHEREIVAGGKAALAKSAARYCAWIEGMVEP
ncbi:hypothetical protein ACFQY5_04595 [Paeniroseomonas aquatica]|uniref:hypothetical protein n=1 Tax=Paeniroseomonas aquatica TaxID=373043 RepID=UPI0036239454